MKIEYIRNILCRIKNKVISWKKLNYIMKLLYFRVKIKRVEDGLTSYHTHVVSNGDAI